MRQRRGLFAWQPVASAAAVGVFAASYALLAAPPEGPDATGHTNTNSAVQIRVGPGVPMDGSLPFFAPVVVDHRKSADVLMGLDDFGELTKWTPDDGLARVTSGDACVIHEECYTCNMCINYECTDFLCTEEIYDGRVGIEGCDDDVFCNGQETCTAGDCLPGDPIPCDPGQYCDEYERQCRAECVGDEDCHEDPDLYCTTDTCVGGECVHTNACGPGATCMEPNAPSTDPVCVAGRCCCPPSPGDPPDICSRETYADCDLAGGCNWAAIGSAATTCDDQPCPEYSSGIVTGSNYTALIGPISHLDCDDLVTVGDDYETSYHATASADQQFLSVEMMRWAGSVEPGSSNGARWSLEFRDETGIFIENTFYFLGNDDTNTDEGIRTIVFDPPIIIPSKGIVSFTVQPNFTPDGRINLFAADAVDIGNNVTGSMYIQRRGDAGGTIRAYLGVCAGGDRDGLICDRANGNADCTDGGTCDDQPNVLAFELVGTQTTSPLAACCDALAGGCSLRLPWECLSEGNIPQATGTLCGICGPLATNGGTPCDDNSQCDGDDCIAIPVCDNAACCDVDAGTCREVSTAGACDDPDGPDPQVGTEEFLGFGTACLPNCCQQPEYKGADNCRDAETDMPVIVVPDLGQPVLHVTITGNNSGATFDDFNIVCLDGPYAGAACADGDGLEDDELCGRCGGAGDANEPCDEDADCPSGEAGACEAGDCDQLCGANIFDPDGDTRDPGWWNAFSIDDCAEVRIDNCCSDVDGDVLRPVWGQIYAACPCDEVQQYRGIDPPIGIGRETLGASRGLPFCTEDNHWMTYLLPQGTYYYPMYSSPESTAGAGVDYQLHITVAACPIAACCTSSSCQVNTELECDALGGNWLSGNVYCGMDDTCALSPEQTDNPCCTGACCSATGCIDEVTGRPLTQADCDVADGDYFGGLYCTDDPCPTCPIRAEGNCQEVAELGNDYSFFMASDQSVAPDLHRVDDFIASDNQLAHVCVWGGWRDLDTACSTATGGFQRCDCGCVDDDQDNCVSQVINQFEVCVWSDDGSGAGGGRSGLPDQLVGCSTSSNWNRFNETYADGQGQGNVDHWLISLELDTAIPLVTGEMYWIEFRNNTAQPPGNRCIFTLHSGEGTPAGGTGNDWFMTDFNGIWEGTDGDALDLSWCIDQPTEAPLPPIGACCLCDPLGGCTSGLTYGECSDEIGNWVISETCYPGLCPAERPANDDCADMLAVTDGVQAFNNLCATIDGPSTIPCRVNEGDPMGSTDVDIGADIWFEYTATCSGRLTINMCDDADYDSALAVYSDGTENCPCPANDALLVDCGDDTCGVGGGPPQIQMIVEAGVCYTLQFGGWRDDDGSSSPECINGCQGSGSFTINCEGVDCPLSLAPQADPLTPDQGNGTKNRYLSFQTTEVGQQQAVRVTFTDLPAPFEYAEGRAMWVQEPTPVTEASGSSGATPLPTFMAARLGCAPFYADWSVYGTVDVYDDALIPDGVYDVQVIHADCSTGNEEMFSDALAIGMSAVGDVVRDCGTTPCSSPNGIIDFVDISAIVDKFRNLLAAPRKARADVINSDVSQPLPDRKVDFVDISYVVDAFRNMAGDPVGPPTTNPCIP